MLRSAFVSAFWAVIANKKNTEKFTFSMLADRMQIGKATISRWFSGYPNWTIDTVSDIANALDADVRIQVVPRDGSGVFEPTGKLGGTVSVSYAGLGDVCEGGNPPGPSSPPLQSARHAIQTVVS